MSASSSVAAATSSYAASSPARLSPSSIRKPSAYCCTSGGGFDQSMFAQSTSGAGAGPSTTKLAHCCSTAVTCLTRPPRQRALTVGVSRACSSVSPADGQPEQAAVLAQDVDEVGALLRGATGPATAWRGGRGALRCGHAPHATDAQVSSCPEGQERSAVASAEPSCAKPAEVVGDGRVSAPNVHVCDALSPRERRTLQPHLQQDVESDGLAVAGALPYLERRRARVDLDGAPAAEPLRGDDEHVVAAGHSTPTERSLRRYQPSPVR